MLIIDHREHDDYSWLIRRRNDKRKRTRLPCKEWDEYIYMIVLSHFCHFTFIKNKEKIMSSRRALTLEQKIALIKDCVCNWETTQFIWSVRNDEKASSLCINWTASAAYSHLWSRITINWYLSWFESGKTKLY